MKKYLLLTAFAVLASPALANENVCAKNPNHPLCQGQSGGDTSVSNVNENSNRNTNTAYGGDATAIAKGGNANSNSNSTSVAGAAAGAVSGSTSSSNNSVSVDASQTTEAAAYAPSVSCGFGVSYGTVGATGGVCLPIGNGQQVRNAVSVAEQLRLLGRDDLAVAVLMQTGPGRKAARAVATSERAAITDQTYYGGKADVGTVGTVGTSYKSCEFRINAEGKRYPHIVVKRGASADAAKAQCLTALGVK
jgi:hypothetical protein